MTKNAANKEQVQEDEKKQSRLDKQNLADIVAVIATPQGRRFYHRIIGLCGVYDEVAEQSGSWTYYNAGKRKIGLILQADLVRASPDAYVSILKEEKELLDVRSE